MIEVLDVLRVLGLGARIRVGHGHQLEEASAVGVGVSPLFGHHLPVSVHHRPGRPGTRVAEEAVADIVFDGEWAAIIV